MTNMKMIGNFVQFIRSGVTGRKSFGTAVKKLLQEWLTARNGNQLFIASIGHSQPSMADLVKMVHPKPVTHEQSEVFSYFVKGRKDHAEYPSKLSAFELFKKDQGAPLPDVPFRALTNCGLTTAHWKQIARNMPWNTLRMNLNMLERNGVFTDRKMVKELAEKLGNPEEVRRNNAFPYQLLTTYQNTNAPPAIKVALNQAMEIATENVPTFSGVPIVCIDKSGSMQSSVTGYRPGSTSVTKCQDVAALVASCMLRQNPDTICLGWDTSVIQFNLNPCDSILTNAERMRMNGGATDASCALTYLNRHKIKGDLVLYVSDNQSWYNCSYGWSNPTRMASEWNAFKKRNRKAKLVCVDITPGMSVQAPNNKDVLNIGGWNDSIWNIVHSFVEVGETTFSDVVKAYSPE
jgi:60 kDa SS-A/Ro ribonucleoprotein